MWLSLRAGGVASGDRDAYFSSITIIGFRITVFVFQFNPLQHHRQGYHHSLLDLGVLLKNTIRDGSSTSWFSINLHYLLLTEHTFSSHAPLIPHVKGKVEVLETKIIKPFYNFSTIWKKP